MKKNIYNYVIYSLVFIILFLSFITTESKASSNAIAVTLPCESVSEAVNSYPVINKDGKLYLISEKGKIINKTALVKIYGGKFYLINGAITYSKWVKINGSWYYFTKSGYAATGWQTIAGKKYYFTQEGIRVKGIQTINSKKYIFSTQNGELLYGWNIYNGHLFYQNKDGQVLTGKRKISDKECMFKDNGIYATPGWITISGNTYYINSKCKALSGFQTINGKNYYFNDNRIKVVGIIVKDGVVYITDCYGVINGKYAENNVKKIISTEKNNTALTLSKTSPENKVSKDKENKQNWILIKDKNGYYRIKNLYSKEYLTYSTCGAVYCSQKEENGSQLWIIKTNTNGYKQISPKLDPNKCLRNDSSNLDNLYSDQVNPCFISWKFEKATINTSQKNSGTVDLDRVIHNIEFNLKNCKTNTLIVDYTYEEIPIIENYYNKMYYFGKYRYNKKNIFEYNSTYITINLNVIKSMKSRHQQVVNRLKEWSSSCGISKNDSNRNKVRKINNKICKELRYNYSEYYSSEMEDYYDDIISGYGICITYSFVFESMCKYWNIPVKIVEINSINGYSDDHALNKVYVDGKWYYCDSTWNDEGNYSSDDYLFMTYLGGDYCEFDRKNVYEYNN